MRPTAVYDTNVIVSGTLVSGSIPASLISAAMHGAVQLYLSEPVLAEYREVLARPKFGFDSKTVQAFLADLQKSAVMVRPTVHLSVALDEPDNRFLECAVTAKAEWLVTGNKSDFPFEEFRGTKIVSPSEFAALLVR